MVNISLTFTRTFDYNTGNNYTNQTKREFAMWQFIFIIVLIFIGIMVVTRSKRNEKREALPPISDAEILARKKELGASEGIGLTNLSGFNISLEYTCGVYLFREKIYFESKGLFLDIPLEYFQRVYTETLSDNSFFRTYKPKLPQFTLKMPTASKLEPEEETIEEHRLVFEVKLNNSEPEHLVFSFGNDKVQKVKHFLERCDEYRKKAAGGKETL